MHAATIGSAGCASSQVTTNSSTAVTFGVDQRIKRGYLLHNPDGTNGIYVGFSSAVTTSTGFRVAPGAYIFIPSSQVMWAVSTAGTPALNIIDIIN